MTPESRNDGELLHGFSQGNDEACFEELVRRHHGMVLGVCRRVARDSADTEEVAQAAFLVLARKSHGLRGRTSVAGWLYHTARQLALVAVRTEQRRKRREQTAAEGMQSDQEQIQCREVFESQLDEALDRLPESYKLPLVLHYLEGLAPEQVAERLGASPDAVYARLSRGRELLRKRLAATGVVLTTTGLPLLLSSQASAAPAASVSVSQIAQAALAAKAGGVAAAAGLVPQTAVTLAQGGLKSMMVAQIQTVAAATLLAAGTIVTGTVAVRAVAGDRSAQGVTGTAAPDTSPDTLTVKGDPRLEMAPGKPPKLVAEEIDFGGKVTIKATGGKPLEITADSVSVDHSKPGLDSEAAADEMIAKEPRLRSIVLPTLTFEDARLSDIFDALRQRSRELDPEGKGVRIVLDPTGDPELDTKTVTISMDNIPLGEAIRYICMGAGTSCRVENGTVIVSARK